MKFPRSFSFPFLAGVAVTLFLSACSSVPPKQQGDGSPVAQTQQGIQVGLNIYDPNKPTQQAQAQNDTTVVVLSPDLSKPLQSPLTIHGKVSGLFFSEGVFPVVILGQQGQEIARTLARADGEWMTQDAVAFTAELTFQTQNVKQAKLVFEKDNPSGLPENGRSQSFDITLQ